jgi:hypothetical protein
MSRETEVLRLITAEKYDEVQSSVASYVEATPSDPESMGKTLEFLQAALIEVRARRAHYATELSNIRLTKSYTVRRKDDPQINLIG